MYLYLMHQTSVFISNMMENLREDFDFFNVISVVLEDFKQV